MQHGVTDRNDFIFGGATKRDGSMNASEVLRLQKYLREKFGCLDINLEIVAQKHDSVEMSLGDEFIGVIYRDDEDGEVSYALQMTILEIDLPPIADVSET